MQRAFFLGYFFASQFPFKATGSDSGAISEAVLTLDCERAEKGT